MITGVVLADRSGEDLAVTLNALIPAVVEGLIGDAVVVARREEAALTRIAEVAGASFLAVPSGEPWLPGASLARREWLLCLEAGDVPGEGWIRAVDRFLAEALRRDRPLGRFSRRPLSGASAVINLTNRLTGTRTVRPGDLVQRAWLAGDRERVRPERIGAALRRDRP